MGSARRRDRAGTPPAVIPTGQPTLLAVHRMGRRLVPPFPLIRSESSGLIPRKRACGPFGAVLRVSGVPGELGRGREGPERTSGLPSGFWRGALLEGNSQGAVCGSKDTGFGNWINGGSSCRDSPTGSLTVLRGTLPNIPQFPQEC
jgi:hypothetical protein